MVIASFFYGWLKLRNEELFSDSLVYVSIIIPMRNEEENVRKLLDCLQRQSYPSGSFEIIMVDDHSADKTYDIAASQQICNLQILSLPEEATGKKAALAMGVNYSKGELIITTDADCYMGEGWLRSIVSYYVKFRSVMIVGPILPLFSYNNRYKRGLEEIMALELFSLLGATAGSASIGKPVMCNGANLAIAREVLPEVVETYTSSAVASGDDMFGMLGLKKKYPGRIHFLKSKEAAVYTRMVWGLSSFLRQRGRWAAKARFYRDPFVIMTAITVFGTNVMLLLTVFYGFLIYNYTLFFVLMVLKSLVDFPLLYSVTSFYGKKKLMRWFPLVQSFYFIYVCITVFYGTVMPNAWKGRRI